MPRKNILLPFLLIIGLSRSVLCAESGGEMLSVYTWDGYFAPAAVARFEAAHGCRVEFTYFESNEIAVESLRHGGGYDVVILSAGSAGDLRRRRSVAAIDHSLIPNLGNIDPDTPALAIDPDMEYSVPFTTAFLGVAYNTTQVSPEETGSWSIFANPRLTGRLALVNDAREVIGAGLKFLGHDLNSVVPEEIREAGHVVRGWRDNIALFSVAEASERFVRGELAAIQTYNGEVAWLKAENPNTEFFIPREGTAITSDQFVIGHDSENVKLAHAFINFFLDPEIAALNMKETGYPMPNRAAREAADRIFGDTPAYRIPPALLEKCQVIQSVDSEAYDLAWEEVLIG